MNESKIYTGKVIKRSHEQTGGEKLTVCVYERIHISYFTAKPDETFDVCNCSCTRAEKIGIPKELHYIVEALIPRVP